MPTDGPRRRAGPGWKQLTPGARAACGVIVLFVLAAVFAPLLTRYQPWQQLDVVRLKSLPPSLAHPFGTDRFSRDVYTRVLYGARVSLAIGALAVLLSSSVGTLYGAVAGYAGGVVDTVMMRIIDTFLSVPRVLLLIAVLALWSPVPLAGLILLIGLTGWFDIARIVRAQAMALRDREFVVAARSLGARPSAIVWRHVLPNVLAPVIVAGMLAVGNVIVLEAGLSFLGIGVREPTASWGTMFQDAANQFVSSWWAVIFPGVAIVATVLALNTLGDALRDLLDPRQLPAHPGSEFQEPAHG
ncbi:MAG TPA: ABC transporter permease [Gemmatimonadaceae bacterium]|nr:ABC transporter permease [Gemmatimonadaceae bacterium]